MRGMKLFLGVSYSPLGWPSTPANVRPPRTLKALTGTSGVGLSAYSARAAASIACTTLVSKPRTLWLSTSESGVSYS